MWSRTVRRIRFKKRRRICKSCGGRETLSYGGLYTNIAPELGYCIDCINRAIEVVRLERRS
jgi:hypothetical protein